MYALNQLTPVLALAEFAYLSTNTLPEPRPISAKLAVIAAAPVTVAVVDQLPAFPKEILAAGTAVHPVNLHPLLGLAVIFRLPLCGTGFVPDCETEP